MEHKKIVTFVSPDITQEGCRCASQLEHDLSITVDQLDTVSQLFPLLSSPSYHTDFVMLDLEKLINTPTDVDIFDIINTLSTLIKCTVHRDTGSRPNRRTTKICILVSDTTDPQLIKQAMLIPDTFLGTIMQGTWTYEMVRDNLVKNFAGDFSTPKHILALTKSKKCCVKKPGSITLTPRERQILSLIQDRGVSNKVIAKILSISESTVKLHVGKVLKKYGCKNRTQLALFLQRHLISKYTVYLSMLFTWLFNFKYL